MTLIDDPIFIGWSACLMCLPVVLICFIYKTNIKKFCAKTVSFCSAGNPKWGDDDYLDDAVDFGSHQKAIRQLQRKFETKTKDLEDKINELSKLRPKTVIRLPVIKLSDARHATHFKPLVPEIAINIEAAPRHKQIAAFNKN